MSTNALNDVANTDLSGQWQGQSQGSGQPQHQTQKPQAAPLEDGDDQAQTIDSNAATGEADDLAERAGGELPAEVDEDNVDLIGLDQTDETTD